MYFYILVILLFCKICYSAAISLQIVFEKLTPVF